MNIGLTLLGQMITFLLFVLFTQRYIFPPVLRALAERQANIASGLAAAARGHHDLELAQAEAIKHIKEAKHSAAHILEDAQKQAIALMESAKAQAKIDTDRLLKKAEKEVEVMVDKARETLRSEVASLVILGAEKVLSRHIDVAANQDLLDKLAEQL